MRLSDIHAHTVKTAVEIFGDQVEVHIRPAVVTSEFESAMQNATDPLELARLLATAVTFIDITEPDTDGVEQPIRCDADTFNRVIPLVILMDIWAAVGKTVRPGEAKGETSANG